MSQNEEVEKMSEDAKPVQQGTTTTTNNPVVGTDNGARPKTTSLTKTPQEIFEVQHNI